MATWSKIGLFGAEGVTPVDIPTDAPIKLNKLEAWTNDIQGIVIGIRFNYTDEKQGKLPVSFGSTNGTHHVLFDIEKDPQDYVVNLYGNTATDYVHRLGVKTKKVEGKPCGPETGKYFEIPVEKGSIVALFGRSNGQSINAVGAYVAPLVAR